jgi:hypothetical protein
MGLERGKPESSWGPQSPWVRPNRDQRKGPRFDEVRLFKPCIDQLAAAEKRGVALSFPGLLKIRRSTRAKVTNP